MGSPSAVTFYDAFKQYIGDGTIDLDSDTFKWALCTSSYVPSASDAVFADITHELSTANGYTAGGQTLTSVTYAQVSGNAKFDADDHTWAATGAGLVFRYEVLYKSGSANGHTNPLVGYRVLDNTPADVSIAAGNSLVVVENAGGIFTLS